MRGNYERRRRSKRRRHGAFETTKLTSQKRIALFQSHEESIGHHLVLGHMSRAVNLNRQLVERNILRQTRQTIWNNCYIERHWD